MINKILLGNPLNANTETEFLKLMNNRICNEKRLFENTTYLDDIDTVIQTLRDKYQNDNTFLSYLIALTGILSHIIALRSEYFKVSTFEKNLSKQNQDKRNENIVNDPNKTNDPIETKY